MSKNATVVESASASPINGAIFSEFFYKSRRKVTTCRKCVLSARGAKKIKGAAIVFAAPFGVVSVVDYRSGHELPSCA